MNSLTRKILSASLMIVLNACAYYPHHYGYSPAYGSYSSGYVVKRSYYGRAPYYYPPPRFQYYTQPIPPRRFYSYPGFPYQHWRHDHDDHGHHDSGNDHHWDNHQSPHRDDHNSHPYKPHPSQNPQYHGGHGFNRPNTGPQRPQGSNRPHR